MSDVTTRDVTTQAEARQLLCAGAEDEVGGAEDPPGFDNRHGWGRLNAYHTLLLASMRIDRVRVSQGTIELSWLSPANASSKHPVRIEQKVMLDDPGTAITDLSAYRFEHGRTFWNGPAAGQARFLRLSLRPF